MLNIKHFYDFVNEERVNKYTFPDSKSLNLFNYEDIMKHPNFEKEYNKWKSKLGNLNRKHFALFVMRQKYKTPFYNFTINFSTNNKEDGKEFVSSFKDLIDNDYKNIINFNNFDMEKVDDIPGESLF
jgi:hypothetical protein